MLVPNPKWARWIKTSIVKHFDAVATANGVHFYLDDTHNDTATYDRFIELRVDGPIVTQFSKGYFRLTAGVNVLYSTDVETNYLDDAILSGLILESFSEICVYKYNDGDAYLGRMLPNDEIVINNFGIIKDTKIKTGSVEAVYEIFLEN